jgi:hypothetical protein
MRAGECIRWNREGSFYRQNEIDKNAILFIVNRICIPKLDADGSLAPT